MEDYSQYIVRGYYAGDPQLERYFRAMMWYGRIGFRQSMEDLDRSVTMLHGQTGYFGLETDVLYCVIAPRELYKLERIVYSIDPDAFVVMSRATSVHGKGFSKAKEYLVRQ